MPTANKSIQYVSWNVSDSGLKPIRNTISKFEFEKAIANFELLELAFGSQRIRAAVLLALKASIEELV